MASRMVKCPVCGTKNAKENTEEYKGRYYCPECLRKKIEEQESRKSDWDRLFEYICQLYNIDKPTGMMFKQLKEYRDEYGYTDSGMYATLRYYHEILENNVLEGAGLGIIPYYYDKARQHYTQYKQVEESVEIMEEQKENVIKVDLTERNKLVAKERIKQLDFD